MIEDRLKTESKVLDEVKHMNEGIGSRKRLKSEKYVREEAADQVDEFSTVDVREIIAQAAFDPKAIQTNGNEVKYNATVKDLIVAHPESDSPTVTLSHQIRHQVAIPPGHPYHPIARHIPNKEPARKYPFKLDSFQKLAISSIERNESVLVSAHTSAGKTVVAEYAIAQSLLNKQRVIYTSPIKALSNQKYRELSAEFGDVGLMTGDISINQDATCLVMTTEILRLMLYRGSEIMREVGWVIFDEIHYMRDRERGVIWEETIILLPDNVRFVFLSATIPNALQFAQWISNIHDQICHVVYTNFRPTPLQHYLFPSGGDGIYLVVDERTVFREENFQRAMASLAEKPSESSQTKGSNRRKSEQKRGSSDIYKLIKMIVSRNYDPVIVFSFSKRECEVYALKMSRLELTTQTEKEMIQEVFENALSSLSEADKTLPQVEHILGLLKRGIGIHHSGLLPILKEIIEILFQESLVKVLFATETFSIGLNMPAKTVVFTSVRKFDGKEFRWVTSGEYIQMSGRAGRRGLDDRGIVIQMIDEKMDPAVAKGMLTGESDRLDSAFHLSYNMILNLLRVEGISAESILEKSFYQFQLTSSLPVLEKKFVDLKIEFGNLNIESEDLIADYHNVSCQIKNSEKEMRKILNHPNHCLQFIQPGRLIKIKLDDEEFDWGLIVNYSKRTLPKNQSAAQMSPEDSYILDVLVSVAIDSIPSKKDFKASLAYRSPKEGQSASMEIIYVLFSKIHSMSQVRIPLPKDLHSLDSRTTVAKSINQVKKHFLDGIPLLDPIEHLKIKDKSFDQLVKNIEDLELQKTRHKLYKSENLEALYEKYKYKLSKHNELSELEKEIKETKSIIQLEELNSRKEVLRRLGFTSLDDLIEIKGRVACEINTGDELVISELIFNGLFKDLSAEQCVALLSCFVFQEKDDEIVKPRKELTQPLAILQDVARRIAKITNECNISINQDEYVESFKITLMDIVYMWAKGSTFASLCKVTEVYEGSIIRAFRRLEELLKQVGEGARAIGNVELELKMEKAVELIHRDIIFSASLYL